MAEELAVCDEGLLEQYLETGMVDDSQIAQLVAERKAFPCYFGCLLYTSDQDYRQAVSYVCLSTILSVATLPLVMLVAERFLS